MNNDRRKAIRALYPQCEELRKIHEAAKVAVEAFREFAAELFGDVDTIMNEEQEYIENLPENLQQGDKAKVAEAAVEALSEAKDMLDQLDVEEFDVDDVIGKLDEAIGA